MVMEFVAESKVYSPTPRNVPVAPVSRLVVIAESSPEAPAVASVE
jgi:hypothetical protein